MAQLETEGAAGMSPAFFAEQMARLNGLHYRPTDLDTHWEGLQTLPEDVLTAAIGRAIVTRADFPSPVELREDADQVASSLPIRTPELEDRSVPFTAPHVISFPQGGQSIRVEAEWRYYCEDCSDLGWRSVWCGDIQAPSRKPWQYPATCERRGAHSDHEWVCQCQCWDWNRALIRKRELAKKYAEQSRPRR